MKLNKSILNGINVNTLRYGVSLWDHSESMFPYYSKIPKTELIKRILLLKHYQEEKEPTLEQCILFKAYSIPMRGSKAPPNPPCDLRSGLAS